MTWKTFGCFAERTIYCWRAGSLGRPPVKGGLGAATRKTLTGPAIHVDSAVRGTPAIPS